MLWITIIEWLARFILLFLVGLSVWSFAIILEKKSFFKKITFNTDDLKKQIRQNKNYQIVEQANSSNIPADILFKISSFKSHEQIEKAYQSTILSEKTRWEKGLPILGTLGSTTPFVGLLGTILGIIVSFGQLSKGGSDTNQIMYSLAEALILTAVGLFVAIPAVVGYNFFNRKIKMILIECESLKDWYLANKE